MGRTRHALGRLICTHTLHVCGDRPFAVCCLPEYRILELRHQPTATPLVIAAIFRAIIPCKCPRPPSIACVSTYRLPHCTWRCFDHNWSGLHCFAVAFAMGTTRGSHTQRAKCVRQVKCAPQRQHNNTKPAKSLRWLVCWLFGCLEGRLIFRPRSCLCAAHWAKPFQGPRA